ncbi:MAG: hypothetical protein ACE5JN_01875 [Candidatus Methylomirabilia bacterium]
MPTRQGKKATKSHGEWEARASQAAQALGLPEAEVRRQTKQALISLVAERIASQEVKKWPTLELSREATPIRSPGEVGGPGEEIHLRG